MCQYIIQHVHHTACLDVKELKIRVDWVPEFRSSDPCHEEKSDNPPYMCENAVKFTSGQGPNVISTKWEAGDCGCLSLKPTRNV